MKTLVFESWFSDLFYLGEVEWVPSRMTLNLSFLMIECWEQDISTVSQDFPGKSKKSVLQWIGNTL